MKSEHQFKVSQALAFINDGIESHTKQEKHESLVDARDTLNDVLDQ